MLARGNEGVAARIKLTEGGLGYLEYAFAKRLALPMALLENKAGQFIGADERSGQTALAESVVGVPEGVWPTTLDPDGPASYPIVTYSWLLLYKRYPAPEKAAALRDFVAWGLVEGQSVGLGLGYVPLPGLMIARGQTALTEIR